MDVGLLVVDDRPETVAPILPIFEERFHPITHAASADDARRAWRADARLRTALIDLNLSGVVHQGRDDVAGFDLLYQLKLDRPHARLLVHSATGDHERLAHAARLGADGFVVKASPPERLRANAHYLHFWANSGVVLSALLAALGGHRLPRLCRALLPHLPNATPKNFDLAACLLAAELLALCKRALPPDASPQAVGESLRPLGPGLERVADVLLMHRRCYAAPVGDGLIDHPSQPATLPRGDALPFEARALRFADALDRLLDEKIAPDAAFASLQSLADRGALDPKFVAACRAWLAAHPDAFARFA